MAKEANVTCSQCGKRVNLGSADKGGKRMLCQHCRKASGEEGKQRKGQLKIKMKCDACSYVFSKVFGSQSVNKCPYCGSSKIASQESITEKLLSEDEEFEDNRFFQH